MGYKKRTKKNRKWISLFIIAFLIVSAWLYYADMKKRNESQLMRYKPLISQELRKYQLDQYTPVLLAIMDQESHGQGNDPMQSSESAGLARNKINSPEESIRQGVYHFSEMFKYGTKMKVDMDTIIQSYNMGPGYISFVSEHGCRNSEELAKSYSKMQVQKFPNRYTCGHNLGNFRYPYCFGDFTYAHKVNSKLVFIEEILNKNSIS